MFSFILESMILIELCKGLVLQIWKSLGWNFLFIYYFYGKHFFYKNYFQNNLIMCF